MKLLRMLCALAGLAALSAFASADEGMIRGEYVFGSENLRMATFGYSQRVSTLALVGTEFTTYKQDPFSDMVYAFRVPVYVQSGGWSMFIKPFYYPSTRLTGGSAGGIAIQNLFSRNLDRGNDSTISFGLGTAYSFQNTDLVYGDGSVSHETIPQMTYDLHLTQNYFNEFNIAMNVSFNQYFRGIQNVYAPSAKMDQSETAFLGTIGVMRDLPLWSAGFDYLRRIAEEGDNEVYAGYHYVTFKNDVQQKNLITLGTRFKMSDKTTFDFAYNWVASGAHDRLNYYRAGVRYMF